jgi:hypothetical protein
MKITESNPGGKKAQRIKRRVGFLDKLKQETSKKKLAIAMKSKKPLDSLEVLANTLPVIDSTEKSKEAAPVLVKKRAAAVRRNKAVSQTARRKSNLSEMKRLQTVQANTGFKNDPFRALREHLKLSFASQEAEE